MAFLSHSRHSYKRRSPMNTRNASAFLFTLLLAAGSISACSAREDRATDTTAATTATANSGAGGMHDMAGMQSDTIVAVVEADLARMDKASPDSLKALLPQHREVVNALIKDCEEMMRMENMSPPRKWINTVADVRQDMASMAPTSAASVKQAWPDHQQHLRSMLNMRHDMMKSMKM